MNDFDLDLEFIFTLTDILRHKRSEFEADVARVAPELTPGAARILVFAARSGPISQVALARRASLEPMTISSFVAALEKQGFVLRTPDPADRRSKIVQLTGKGEDCLGRILGCMRRSEAKSRAVVTKAQWKTALAVLSEVRSEQEQVSEGLPVSSGAGLVRDGMS